MWFRSKKTAPPPLDVDRLEQLGFFRYLDGPARAVAIRKAREANFAFAEETHRLYHADAEDLAERGTLDFLGSVAPILRREGVELEVDYRPVKMPARSGRPPYTGAAILDADGWIDPEGPRPRVASMRVAQVPGALLEQIVENEDDDGGHYMLYIGDKERVLYDESTHEEIDDWEGTAKAVLRLLDEWLAAHGSAERAYGLHGGNDLSVVFVTPDMAAVIDASAASERERLWRAT
jgi:hypothetical protein